MIRSPQTKTIDFGKYIPPISVTSTYFHFLEELFDVILSCTLYSVYETDYSLIQISGRMWNHCRMVYLPMSYLYGKRFVGPITPTVLSLRKELYTVPYSEIDWDRARNECAKVS